MAACHPPPHGLADLSPRRNDSVRVEHSLCFPKTASIQIRPTLGPKVYIHTTYFGLFGVLGFLSVSFVVSKRNNVQSGCQPNFGFRFLASLDLGGPPFRWEL